MKLTKDKRIVEIKQKITLYARAHYEMVTVIPKQGMFNYMCHCNSVEYAKLHIDTDVYEVICIDNGRPCMHYINRNKLTGEYLETTLGFRAKNLEYYVIRKIHPNDYDNILDEFDRSLTSWQEIYTNWYDRVILRIDRVL